MFILDEITKEIDDVGVKEIARRSGLSPSTISRVRHKQISPSFEVIQKISEALGKRLQLVEETRVLQAPRLISAKRVLSERKDDLRVKGVEHVFIFGSVARGEDHGLSDVDVYLDFGKKVPRASDLLSAEGLILEAFGEQKVDLVSRLSGERGQRILERIKREGVRVF